jgi:hypothetical protein
MKRVAAQIAEQERHLTPEQKRELIQKVLRADPTKSDRQIARAVKVDNKTVGAVRKRAEAREEIPHVSKRTDTKGRSQVAHKRNSAKRQLDRRERKPRYGLARPDATHAWPREATAQQEAQAGLSLRTTH